MPTTAYRNGFNGTTTSAPTLTDAAGDLIAVLDFVLLDQGWTKPYTLATNHVVYQQPTGTTEFFLEVDDTNAGYAIVQGWGAHNGTTGIDPLPSAAAYWPKAPTGSANWIVTTDGAAFILCVEQAAGNGFAPCVFGTFPSYLPTDLYNCLLLGGTSTSLTTAADNWTGPSAGARAIIRDYSQTFVLDPADIVVADAVRATASADWGKSGTSYPSPIGAALLMSQLVIRENTHDVRGKIPGLWVPLHDEPLPHGDYFTAGSGSEAAGKTFEVWGWSTVGQWLLETSNWT